MVLDEQKSENGWTDGMDRRRQNYIPPTSSGIKKGKFNQRGITWKLNMEEQSFIQTTNHLYLKHIPIKFHEDTPNNY